MSFHDDYIEENARFRNDSGLRCYISRELNGKGCPWCRDLAGRYVYGEEPEDVYRRHDNCACTVTYENGRQRQDVWSKKSWSVKPSEKDFKPVILKNDRVEGIKPTKFTPEQAKNIESQNLKYQGIDNSENYDRIESGIPYLDSKPRLENHDIDDCYNTVNPNYEKGEEYQKNCQRCVVAYEARRRGFDVVAKPAALEQEPLKHSYGKNGWANIFENGEEQIIQIYGNNPEDTKNNIISLMTGYGEGARAAIEIHQSDGGHVFIAEQLNEGIAFIDPQTGERDVEYIFDMDIKFEMTKLLRIDDKNFTSLIRECVE